MLTRREKWCVALTYSFLLLAFAFVIIGAIGGLFFNNPFVFALMFLAFPIAAVLLIPAFKL